MWARVKASVIWPALKVALVLVLFGLAANGINQPELAMLLLQLVMFPAILIGLRVMVAAIYPLPTPKRGRRH